MVTNSYLASDLIYSDVLVATPRDFTRHGAPVGADACLRVGGGCRDQRGAAQAARDAEVHPARDPAAADHAEPNRAHVSMPTRALRSRL